MTRPRENSTHLEPHDRDSLPIAPMTTITITFAIAYRLTVPHIDLPHGPRGDDTDDAHALLMLDVAAQGGDDLWHQHAAFLDTTQEQLDALTTLTRKWMKAARTSLRCTPMTWRP